MTKYSLWELYHIELDEVYQLILNSGLFIINTAFSWSKSQQWAQMRKDRNIYDDKLGQEDIHSVRDS
jgi:hypothetical protein